jgi:hypothetical protein
MSEAGLAASHVKRGTPKDAHPVARPEDHRPEINLGLYYGVLAHRHRGHTAAHSHVGVPGGVHGDAPAGCSLSR